MPAEWEEHICTWMAFPPTVYGTAAPLEGARRAWMSVAHALSPYEPVHMMVRPEDRAAAEDLSGGSVHFHECALDDAWARDIGPTFVRDIDGQSRAVDWRFNGWGAQSWARWENDDRVAATVAAEGGVPAMRSTMVNEGGGIEVDGAGRLVVTSTVQEDPGRNPGVSRDALNDELASRLGVEQIVWLPRGLTGDYLDFGTRGHVDLLVKFVAPGVALFHDQRNTEHPDVEVSREIRDALTAAGIDAVPLPAPRRLEVEGRVCDWSYVNCYVANGVVVLGTYDDPADDEAADILAAHFPGRNVVRVDARPLFALGGGVHCITQQQPR